MPYFLKLLCILGISMVPVVELRGAIPIGYYTFGVDIWTTVILSVIGNILPVPFLVVFGGKVLNRCAEFPRFGKPFRAILRLGEKKVAKMNKTLFWGLMLFVAIPLPGTGAWTGSLIAITLQLKLKKAILPICLGVLIAGAIILTVFYFLPGLFTAIVGKSA